MIRAQAQYPPLPDLFLDNIPRIPVAFKLTEMIGVVLFIILCVVVMLHKHRLIILRRGLSIAGSIFLLRCVTMLATSLSVPSRHLQCEGGSFGDTFEEKMARAWEIASHFGMTIAGVQTCGDYLFSGTCSRLQLCVCHAFIETSHAWLRAGHSVAVTMLNFLITEYVALVFLCLLVRPFTMLLGLRCDLLTGTPRTMACTFLLGP
mgnify:CR=1 FL=1